LATPVDLALDVPAGTPLSTVVSHLDEIGVKGPLGTLYVDGQRLADSAVLGLPPLVEGALLTVVPAGATGSCRGEAVLSGLELRVTGGPTAGRTLPLDFGSATVGRSPGNDLVLDDPTVSRQHLAVTVTGDGASVRDLGGRNGSTVDGSPLVGITVLPVGAVVRVGDSSLELAESKGPAAALRPDGSGTLAYNRAPRVCLPRPTVEVVLPSPPHRPDLPGFPWLAAGAPLLVGGVLAAALGPQMLLFLLLSPIAMISHAVGDRATRRRAHRAALRRHTAAAADAAASLAAAVVADARAQRAEFPDCAALLSWATSHGASLWQRRRGDHDAFRLRVGSAAQPSRVFVRADHQGECAPAAPRSDNCPVVLNLAELGVIGLAGPAVRRRALARALVVQLATLHSPRDVTLVLLAAPHLTDSPGDAADASDSWRWARWLPHLRQGSGDGLLVGLTASAAATRVAEVLAVLEARSRLPSTGASRAWNGPVTVVLLDEACTLRSSPDVARLLELGPQLGVYCICLDDDEQHLPEECLAVAVLEEGPRTRLRLRGAGVPPVDDVIPDLICAAQAERVARALAPLLDLGPSGETGLPEKVRLLELLGLTETTGEVLATRWSRPALPGAAVRRGGSTVAVLGVRRQTSASDNSTFTIDLRTDGPHALVAGTTGSGKSELLQTLVASLAAVNRPDELTFVLVDYKGGAAFHECARLPHVVGLVTDLDSSLTQRALRSLHAELRRRESLLAAAGVADLEAYLTLPGTPALPRLVLVVDEFATLVEELPDFVPGLVGVAQRGRSLGVHLILATQRPGGVVSADIRANTGLRLALRVIDAGDSTDVLGRPDAAQLSKATPGRAYARSGSGPLTLFQAARVGQRSASAVGVRLRVLPWPPPEHHDHGDIQPLDETDLARLARSAQEAASLLAVPPQPSPWLPPLPDLLCVTDLPRPASAPASRMPPAAWGLVDLPDRQAREPLLLDPSEAGHLLIAGTARSGRTTALRTLAGVVAERYGVGDVHLYALDCGGGGLAGLAALPQCGAVVPREHAERGNRLLRRLLTEVEDRHRALAAAGVTSLVEQRAGAAPGRRLPWMLLLLDGWEGFLADYDQIDHGRPVEALLRLLREGPSVGLRVVLTGDRQLLTSRVAAAVPERVLLRLADPADAALAGLPARAMPPSMPAGRAIRVRDATSLQIALLAEDPAGAAQNAALQLLAGRAGSRAAADPAEVLPLRVRQLPERVPLKLLDHSTSGQGPLWTVLGVGGDAVEPVGVDLAENGPGFLVAGPARSGRSTALLTLARGLAVGGCPVLVVGARRSPLRNEKGRAGVLDVLTDLCDRCADQLRHHLQAPGPLVVLADDAEDLADTPVGQVLLEAVRPSDVPRAVVLAGATDRLSATYRGVVAEARRTRCGLLLNAASPLDGDLLGLRLPHLPPMPAPGRGVLALRGQATVVQVADP